MRSVLSESKPLKYMPRGDGTGPLGYGPRTGRGMGRCRFPHQRQGLSKEEKLKLLKEDKKAIEKEIASLEK
jgi:hypothetical protein